MLQCIKLIIIVIITFYTAVFLWSGYLSAVTPSYMHLIQTTSTLKNFSYSLEESGLSNQINKVGKSDYMDAVQLSTHSIKYELNFNII